MPCPNSKIQGTTSQLASEEREKRSEKRVGTRSSFLSTLSSVFQHLPRNATATGFFAFDWDGTRIHSNMTRGRGNQNELFKVVPNGDYVITIRVLKALGNPNNPAHWETWTSPVITIARP